MRANQFSQYWFTRKKKSLIKFLSFPNICFLLKPTLVQNTFPFIASNSAPSCPIGR